MEIIINGQLKITLPDGFHVLDEEELKRFFIDDHAEKWAAQDKNAHVLVAVYWRKLNFFTNLLADERSILKGAQAKIQKGLAAADYKRGEYYDDVICGKKACSFDYSYVMEGIAHSAKATVVKGKNNCYVVYYFTHTDKKAENESLREKLAGSLTFVG